LVGDVGDVLVHVDVVIDVGDLNAIDDGGVVDVDAFDVTLRDVVGRAVDVTGAKWEPRHAGANRDANSEAWAANPGDECRSVDRTNIGHGHHRGTRRDRHPAPHSANDNPAAVMERSEPPGRVVNPSPSPGRNPNPVAIAIGRPADDRGVWEPDRAVVRRRAPATIFIEVFVADDVI
jgi:hypothetical protein